MRNLNYLNQYRKPSPLFPEEMGDEFNGFFQIRDWYICASNGGGWDHVSITRYDEKIPKWGEMCNVKDMFFEKHETVVQFHPKETEYIDNCRYCLHLWRNQDDELQLPPSIFVGVS
jgi:hypothetical protein